MRLSVFAILACLVLLTNCGKKRENCPYTCQDIHVYPVLPYAYSDVDTVIVWRFHQDSTFSSPVDTLQLAVDTTFYSDGLHLNMEENYDFTIILPSVHDTFRLIHSSYSDKTVQDNCELGKTLANSIHANCYNDVPQYAIWLNGQAKTVSPENPKPGVNTLRLSR